MKRGFASLVAVALAGPALAQMSMPAGTLVVQAAPGAVPQPLPAARWTLQQVRQAFDLADADSDGQLTRAEATHLTLMPQSFEDMDLNKDGVLSRAEYEAAFNRPSSG